MNRKLLLIPAIFAGFSAMAQTETPVEPPKKEPVVNEDMHIRADKNIGYGAESSFLVWHGYLNFEFDKKQGTNSNFDNHEFYLSAKSDIGERVSIVAEFEYEHNPEKLILPIQAYAIYKFSDAFMVRAGVFYTPLGMPRTYTLRAPRNRFVRQQAVTHDISYENWSETGIEILGEFKNGLFYDVSISNGMPNTIAPGDSWFDAKQDLQNHTEDNNENKALTGRFGYHSRNFLGGELNVAVSGVTQKMAAKDSIQSQHTAFDLRYVHPSGWRFQGEWMQRGGDEHYADLATYGVSMDAVGWYAQLSKRFVSSTPKKHFNYIEPVVQVDYIDLNTNLNSNKDLMTASVGLVYSPAPFYLVKFEYDIVKEKYGAKVDNNIFWASIVVEF